MSRTDENPCEDCGRPNHPIAWHVPDELWLAVVGHSSGFLCIPCFTDRAMATGIEISWMGSRFDIGDPATWHISMQMNLEAATGRAEALEGVYQAAVAWSVYHSNSHDSMTYHDHTACLAVGDSDLRRTVAAARAALTRADQ